MAGQQGAVAEYKDGVQFLQQGRLRLEYDEEIHYLNVEKSMIINLLSRMKKFNVERMQHFWQIQERKKDFVTLDATPAGGAWAGGAAATGTLLLASLTDAFLIAKNDLFIIASVNETLNFYVDSIDQGTGIITARTVTGATIDLSAAANGKDIFLTSNSFEDGGGRGTIKAENPTDIHNFVQIIQTPLGVTTTFRNHKYRGVNEWDKLMFERGSDHAFKMEKQVFFGEKHFQTTGYENGIYGQWFSGGLTEQITSNLTDAAGGLDQDEFDDHMNIALKYAQNPLAFAGELIFEGLTKWSQTDLQLMRNENTFGMAIAKYVDRFGKPSPFTPHRELLQGPQFGGSLYNLDLKELAVGSLKGLDTHMEVDVQDNDQKQKIDEFRTWFTFKWGNERRHARLHNATSIVV